VPDSGKKKSFETQEAEIIIPQRPSGWSAYFASDKIADPDFMDGVEDLPVQKRPNA